MQALRSTQTLVTDDVWRAMIAADAPAVRELARVCARADGGRPSDILESALDELVADPAAYESRSLVVARPDGRLTAAAIVVLDERPHERRAFLEGLVQPESRGRGLGGALLAWLESQARALLARYRADRPNVLRIDITHQNQAAIALYESRGFRFAFAEDEMQRDLALPLPDAATHAAITYAPWTAERAQQFFEVYAAAFRERPGFPGWSEAIWRANMTGDDMFRPDLSLLMRDGERPVGYALCGVEPERPDAGHIIQMGVHPDARRRGLGGRLLLELMRRFRADGLTRAILEVNTNNPGAISVYRRLGFERTLRYASYRKEL
jgi:mycothiol synthase